VKRAAGSHDDDDDDDCDCDCDGDGDGDLARIDASGQVGLCKSET